MTSLQEIHSHSGDVAQNDATIAATEAREKLAAASVPAVAKDTKGAQVVTDASGEVTKITRPNGSFVEAKYAAGAMTEIDEVRNDGRKVEWHKDSDADRWRSMSYIGAQRINFKVNDLGQTSFEDVAGTTYTTNGDGSQTRKTYKGSTVEVDKDWQIRFISRADGSTVRLNYNGKDLSQVEETVGTNSTTWTKNVQSGQWTAPDHRDVRTNVSVSDSGDLSFVDTKKNQVRHIEYANGDKRDFRWSNGQVFSIIETTPTGTATWTRAGQTDTFVNGTTAETRKNLLVDSDGDLSYTDAAGLRHTHKFNETEEVESPTEITRSSGVSEAREKLLATAKDTYNTETLRYFSEDIDTFEKRAHTAGLKDAQVEAALKDVNAILAPTADKPFVDKDARLKLAAETLQHIAEPRGIDQGFHNTCGATTAETFVATLHPEKFTALVREVADTGKFTATDGTVVQPPEASLRADWEAVNRTTYAAAPYGRSYASQLFQVIGINAAYQADGGKYRYEQGRPENPKDTGERDVKIEDGTKSDFTGLIDPQVRNIARLTSGEEAPVLRRGTEFKTADELREKLTSLLKNHALPAVLWVHTKNEPFWSDNGHGRGGGSGGGHYVTLWDIDANGRIAMDNQWGRESDYESMRRLSVQQIFDAAAG